MKTMQKSITKQKESGIIYTPSFIVDNILDLAGYCGRKILRKHAIDNSCGNGAFLCRMVERYCEAAQAAGYSAEKLKADLSEYIHGIEILPDQRDRCIGNVAIAAARFGIYDVSWDIVCADALSLDCYDGRMTFVLGNPPYVRVHNLGDTFDEIKKFSFAQKGMTDLYIAFYELGIKMLTKDGVLGYITPSSYFNSIAGSFMRKYLVSANLIDSVVDLRHFQAFSATAYTAITILKKNKKSSDVDFYRYDEKKLTPYFVSALTPEDFIVKDSFCFAEHNELDKLKKIRENKTDSGITVKNGYATLCDSVFVHDFDFDSEHIIPVVKSSKGIFQKIFFPYDEEGRIYSEDEFRKNEKLYSYLLDNKEKLTRRSNDRDAEKYWYAYGRSQAIGDTYKDKLTINSLVRSKDDLKFVSAPSGTGVYGGLYIMSNSVPAEEIISALKTDDFISYIALLGKYKSGGYYAFSSKDVKAYLDYVFALRGDEK